MSDKGAVLPSLRRELRRTLVLISTFWLSAVFLTMAFGIRHEVDDLLDDALHESAEVLYGILVLHGPHLPSRNGGSLPAPRHEERLVWQIVDGKQQIVLRSHKAPATPLLQNFTAGLSDAPDHWRVYAMRLPDGQQVLYVGQPAVERFEARYEVIAVVGVSAIAVGLACALWLRRRVRRAMQPLQELSEQIKAYDPVHPRTELPPPSRQEFVEVRQAIVDLGQRLARRVKNEQAFAAHAAHALRTPLAGMDAQLAMAMKEVPDAALPRLERAREAVLRLKRVVTSLLALFRANATLDLQDIDLSELVSHLPVDALSVHVSQEAQLTADPNLLAAALLNLLDNAARYGAHTCWISCRADGQARYISVRDDGPGLPPQRCVLLQQSLDQPGDTGFSGLGLKLATLIAQAHKGGLTIDGAVSANPGFSVTLGFWLDQPET